VAAEGPPSLLYDRCCVVLCVLRWRKALSLPQIIKKDGCHRVASKRRNRNTAATDLGWRDSGDHISCEPGISHSWAPSEIYIRVPNGTPLAATRATYAPCAATSTLPILPEGTWSCLLALSPRVSVPPVPRNLANYETAEKRRRWKRSRCKRSLSAQIEP
jgi:hypothetical protein